MDKKIISALGVGAALSVSILYYFAVLAPYGMPSSTLSPSVIELTEYAWPSYQHDSMLSGHSASEIGAELEQLWRLRIGASDVPYVVVGEGYVCVGADNGVFYCLNALGGNIIWTYDTHMSRMPVCPLIYEGRVYFAANDYQTTAGYGGTLYCCDIESGALVWSLDFDGIVGGSGNGIHGLNGHIYWVPDPEGRTYCIDATMGEVVWKGVPIKNITVGQGAVYGTYSSMLIGLDIDTGDLMLNSSIPDGHRGFMIYGDMAYVGDGDSVSLLLYDIYTGDLVGRMKTIGGVVHIASAPGKILVISEDRDGLDECTGYIECYDADSRTLLWHTVVESCSLNGKLLSTPTKVIHVLDKDVTIYSLETGGVVGQFSLPYSYLGRNSAIADSRLYILARNHIICYE